PGAGGADGGSERHRLHLVGTAVPPDGRPGVIDDLARLAARRMRAHWGALCLVARDREVPLGIAAPPDGEPPPSVPRSLPRRVVDTGGPVVAGDLVPRGRSPGPSAAAVPRAYAAVPLRAVGGAVLGAVAALDVLARVWSAEDAAALDDVAALAGHALAWRIAAETAPPAPLAARLRGGALVELVALMCEADRLALVAVAVEDLPPPEPEALGRIRRLTGRPFAAPSGPATERSRRAAGREIGRWCRWGDALLRVGPDRFLVLCPGVAEERDARAIARRLDVSGTPTPAGVLRAAVRGAVAGPGDDAAAVLAAVLTMGTGGDPSPP
ncbi:MAG TPA: GAF domain-containing protein, partial [Miltoncostaeaceae bacterium]|nr:GAF domain-containing protein [Miltoncostaeaceae bacterium]